MKRTKPFLLVCLFALLAGTSYSAGIDISGETIVNSSTTFTYYATPVVSPPSGTTYTWQVDPGSIIEQNTDPAAGPIYCVVQFLAVLGEGAVQIDDNNGNSDIFYIVCYGLTWQWPAQSAAMIEGQASISLLTSPALPGEKMVRQFNWAIRKDNVLFA